MIYIEKDSKALENKIMSRIWLNQFLEITTRSQTNNYLCEEGVLYNNNIKLSFLTIVYGNKSIN